MAGVVLLGTGLVLMILPGPGIPLVVAGLSLLEWDVPWLRRLRRGLVETLATCCARPGPSARFAGGTESAKASSAGRRG